MTDKRNNRFESRRDFLKMTTAAAAGIAATGSTRAAFANKTAWTSGMPVNPDIDNMRVVCCHDTAMLKPNATLSSFAAQNNGIDSARVSNNLDQMAISLASKSGQTPLSADQAWRKIFRSSKEWAGTVVAIKVNAVNTYNMPHMAIVSKLVAVLSGFGVVPANILLYDGSTTASGSNKYSPYFTLDTSDSTKTHAVVSNLNESLGGLTDVTLPSQAVGSTYKCTTLLATGQIDILINLAVNKGHDRINLSGFTGCSKNHYGTFWDPNAMHEINFMFDINKHDAILGGSPVRQQLCIIDSILACTDGPDDRYLPDVVPLPCRLVMGTFAPAVDWYVARKLREPNNWYVPGKYSPTVMDRYLTEFGYTAADLDAIEIAGGPNALGPQKTGQSRETFFELRAHGQAHDCSAYFAVPRVGKTATIFDSRGRVVRRLFASSFASLLLWDGNAENGRRVGPGFYPVRVTAGSVVQNGLLHLYH